MGTETLLQLGVGAIALLVLRDALREIFALLRRRQGTETSSAGDKSVDFWRQQQYEAARRATDDAMAPLLNELHEIRLDTTKLRESQHRTVEATQQVAGKLDVLIRLQELRRA